MPIPIAASLRVLLLCLLAAGATLGGCRVHPPAPPAAAALSDLEWMVGTWRCTDQDGAWIEERWSVPAGDAMVGTGRTVRDGRLAECEFIRIVQRSPQERVYLASPGGSRPPVEFRQAPPDPSAAPQRPSATRGEAVFENPGHDFPQRIAYRRDGDQLVVSISGDVEGKRSQYLWVMFRAP